MTINKMNQIVTASLFMIIGTSCMANGLPNDNWTEISGLDKGSKNNVLISHNPNIKEGGYIQIGNDLVSRVDSVNNGVIVLERELPEGISTDHYYYTDQCEIPVLNLSKEIPIIHQASSISIDPNAYGLYANGNQQTHVSYSVNLLASNNEVIKLPNSTREKIIEFITPYIKANGLQHDVCRSDQFGTSYSSTVHPWFHGLIDNHAAPITGIYPNFLSLDKQYAGLDVSLGATLKVMDGSGKVITIKTTENAERHLKPVPAPVDYKPALEWSETNKWWGWDWRAYWAGRNNIGLTAKYNGNEIPVRIGSIDRVDQLAGKDLRNLYLKSDQGAVKIKPWFLGTGDHLGTWYATRVTDTKFGANSFVIKAGTNRIGASTNWDGCVDQSGIIIKGSDVFGNPFTIGDYTNGDPVIPVCYGSKCTKSNLEAPGYNADNCNWKAYGNGRTYSDFVDIPDLNLHENKIIADDMSNDLPFRP
jgi:hypothetical protein